MGKSLFLAVALICIEAAKGVVVGELEIAIMDLLECLYGKLVVGDDVGGGKNGSFDIVG